MSKFMVIGVFSLILCLLSGYWFGQSRGPSGGAENPPKVVQSGFQVEQASLCQKSDMCFIDENTGESGFSALEVAVALKPKDYVYEYTLIANKKGSGVRDLTNNQEDMLAQVPNPMLIGMGSVEKNDLDNNATLDAYCRSANICIRRSKASYDDMLGNIRSIGLGNHEIHFYMTMNKAQ